MNMRWLLVVSLALCWKAPVSAQPAWQFRWEKGQSLHYKVIHTTQVSEVVDKNKSESSSRLDLVKRWHVKDVDNTGTATLELSLVKMRNEQKRTNGETLLFDSEHFDKSTPGLREEMNKFIGKTLAVLRIDRFGRVVETKFGAPTAYDAEPPFVVVLPDAKVQAGQGWRRPYTIVLDPPHGTGEKYQAEQTYQCKKLDASKAHVSVSTQFKTTPESIRERLPLLQKDIQGEVVFDVESGRVVSAQVRIDRTIENHQGKGSSYRLQSTKTETLVE